MKGIFILIILIFHCPLFMFLNCGDNGHIENMICVLTLYVFIIIRMCCCGIKIVLLLLFILLLVLLKMCILIIKPRGQIETFDHNSISSRTVLLTPFRFNSRIWFKVYAGQNGFLVHSISLAVNVSVCKRVKCVTFALCPRRNYWNQRYFLDVIKQV